MAVPAILFYDVVVALHVMSIIAAFGVWFAWPLLPAGSAADHGARLLVLRRLVTPAATLALLLGAYLATDRHYWGKVWVAIPLVIIVVLLGITGAYLTPREQRLGELASAGDTAAYRDLAGQVTRVVAVGAGLVLVAVFFMVTKLGD